MVQQTQTPAVIEPITPATNAPDSASVEFLNKECERMMTLYTQTQANIQNVFNFYLTFVSAVIGGIVFIVQSSDDVAPLLLGGILFFAVVVGSVYLSALSGRYAHAARYAHAVDEIRRYLIKQQNISLPSVYDHFREPHDRALQGRAAWIYWLIPSGTFQMFISIVNSAATGAVVGVVFLAADASGGRTLFAITLVFLITLTIFNAYSRLVIQRFSEGVHVYVLGDSPAWAARE